MNIKKGNIFTLLIAVIMFAVSIYIGMSKNAVISNLENTISELKLDLSKQADKIEESAGMSAYEIAVEKGFVGTESEWLLSLKGINGTNALESVSVTDIFNAYNNYLLSLNRSTVSYDEFITYYYSVIDDEKSATQLAYSTTVDICYSYYCQTYYVQSTGTGISVNLDKSGLKGSAGAGAGVIYQMLDTDSNSELDTAYIITNYHVAYIENYSNDPDYAVYANYSSDFFGNITINKYFLAKDYQKVSDDEEVKELSVDEAISKHFLIGTNGQYYGIYLYGYQEAEYKLNATFVGGSADNDIAVLKIERENISDELAKIFFDSGNYFGASIGDSTDLVGGEEVIAVGNPLIPNLSGKTTVSQYEQAYVEAMVLSSTTGVVSVISDEVIFDSLIDSTKTINMRLIRVDAAINSGNSGGGLYDLNGRLIGIVNAKIASSSYDNLGYAIPVNISISIADQVIRQCEGISPSSTNTRIKRLETENIGFKIENGVSNSKVKENSNGQKEWFVSYNILIKDIDETSVAYTSGLRNDDIILEVSFGGNTYSAQAFFNLDYELRDLLLNVSLNCSQIAFKVSRVGSEQTINISLTSENFVEIC